MEPQSTIISQYLSTISFLEHSYDRQLEQRAASIRAQTSKHEQELTELRNRYEVYIDYLTSKSNIEHEREQRRLQVNLEDRNTEHNQQLCGKDIEIAHLKSDLQREVNVRKVQQTVFLETVAELQRRVAEHERIAQGCWQLCVEADANMTRVEDEIEAECKEQFEAAVAVWDEIVAKLAVEAGRTAGLIELNIERVLDFFDKDPIPRLGEVLRGSNFFQQLWEETQMQEQQQEKQPEKEEDDDQEWELLSEPRVAKSHYEVETEIENHYEVLDNYSSELSDTEDDYVTV